MTMVVPAMEYVPQSRQYYPNRSMIIIRVVPVQVIMVVPLLCRAEIYLVPTNPHPSIRKRERRNNNSEALSIIHKQYTDGRRKEQIDLFE
mmetsp:Transcript_42870/g.48617  ORF Transcript_42870/g.48617 Transcript_42870/m.48617 type:complete len:90 (+) Transcript_42870:681-950(+)